MKQRLKSLYLTYNGHVATPDFPVGDVSDMTVTKVFDLRDAFLALGVQMEIRAVLVVDDENELKDGEQEK